MAHNLEEVSQLFGSHIDKVNLSRCALLLSDELFAFGVVTFTEQL